LETKPIYHLKEDAYFYIMLWKGNDRKSTVGACSKRAWQWWKQVHARTGRWPL